MARLSAPPLTEVVPGWAYERPDEEVLPVPQVGVEALRKRLAAGWRR